MIHIDHDTCRPCGLCGQVCPRHILEVVEIDGAKRNQVVEERLDLCMGCGHCASVCPQDALEVDGLPREAYGPVEPMEIRPEQLATLLRQRRSVRRYKRKPVPREVLDQIADAVRLSPTGTGTQSNGLIIVDDRAKIDEMMRLTYPLYADLDKLLRNPIARFFVKRKVGAKTLGTLERFVLPGARWYQRWYGEGISDEISRDCPALLIFTSPTDEPMYEDNCTLASFHAVLMAETVGIGTCLNHLIPPAINRVPALRELVGLPEGVEAVVSVTLGYPALRFLRTPPRKAEVRVL